ncbi:MAG: tetratricopeptide repeat protein [Proteobacteria bacterium]|nr:tetratricopeptide repeat protein [Pseudomonadota bacterium]
MGFHDIVELSTIKLEKVANSLYIKKMYHPLRAFKDQNRSYRIGLSPVKTLFLSICCLWLFGLSLDLFAADNAKEKRFDPQTTKELIQINDLVGRQDFAEASKRLNILLEKHYEVPRLHLLKASIISRQRTNQAALDYLSSQIEQQPENIGMVSARAQFLFNKGYFESAREDFYRVYLENHRPVEILSVLAKIEGEKGRIGKAIEFTNQALEIDPNSDSLWFKKAELELKLAQVGNAKASCYKATQLAPESIKYHKLYVEILIYLKQRDELQKHIRLVYDLFPSNPWISLRMSSLLVEQGNLKEAIEILVASLKKNPNEHLLMFQIATILAGQRNWEEAIRFFKAGLSRKPDSSWAMIQVAKIYLQTGKANPALDYLEKARENKTRDPFVYETLARIYNRQNDTFEAERIILEGLEINEKNQTLILEYANLLEKRGKTKETTIAYEEALKNDDDNSFILGKLGNLYRINKRYDQSLAALEKAIKIDPKSTWIRAYYIETLDELGEWNNALDEINELLEIMPKDYWAFAKKALIELEIDRLEEAYISVRQSIVLRPDANWLKEIEGRILEGLKKYNKAEKAFKDALRKEPDGAHLLTQLAYVQVHLDKNQALKNIKKSLDSDDFEISTIELNLYLTNKAIQYWQFAKHSSEYRVYEQIIHKEFSRAEKGLARLKKTNSPHVSYLSYFLQHMKRGKKDELDLSKIASSKVKAPWHYYYLGIDSIRKNDYERARMAFEKGLEKSADNPWMIVKLSYVLQQLKEYKEAVNLLNRFLRLEKNGEFMWVQLRLALNYDLAKKFSDSERVYKQILKKNPKDNVALNNLAWMYLNATEEKMQKLDDALKLALKAVEIRPSSANLDTLAEAYFQKKDYNRALKAIERALDKDRRGLDDFKKTKKKIIRAMEAEEKK